MLRQVNPHYKKNPDQNSKKYTTKLKNYHSNPPYNCVLSLLYKHVYDNQPGKIHSTFYMNKVTFPKKNLILFEQNSTCWNSEEYLYS